MVVDNVKGQPPSFWQREIKISFYLSKSVVVGRETKETIQNNIDQLIKFFFLIFSPFLFFEIGSSNFMQEGDLSFHVVLM